MDGSSVFRLPSMFSALFMDGSSVFRLPFMFSPLFMDGSTVFRLPFMFSPLFMDGRDVQDGPRSLTGYTVSEKGIVSKTWVVRPYFFKGFCNFLRRHYVLLLPGCQPQCACLCIYVYIKRQNQVSFAG